MRATGSTDVQAWLEGVLAHIRDEYDQMPGLCLTLPQAQRLWALDAQTCHVALARMVDVGFLAASPFGYVRGDGVEYGRKVGGPCQHQTPQRS